MEKDYININYISIIIETINKIDNEIGYVTESPDGKPNEFRLGRIIESLILSGVNFYSALSVLADIEKKLYPNIETRIISETIIQELESINSKWAAFFRINYGEGITIQINENKSETLRISTIKDYVKQKTNAKGFVWGNKKSFNDFSARLLERCRKLGISNIPITILDELFEQELFIYLENHTIDDLYQTFPSMVHIDKDNIVTYINHYNDQTVILNSINRLCKAILFKFSYLPSMETFDCINEMILMLEEKNDPNSSFYEAITNFISYQKKDTRIMHYLQGKKCPEGFIIDGLIHFLRKLSYFTSRAADLTVSDEIKRLLNEENSKTILNFLINFTIFLWPEEDLAATTKNHLRYEILTLLYRYRCMSIIKITKKLQVHPKHIFSAITPLINEGLIIKHRLVDGELIIITSKGEDYCEQNLGLKLRCSLSLL